jgi:DNA modification methylase
MGDSAQISVSASLVALDDITVGDRHRKDLGDIQALADSILSVGLLQPVVVSRDRHLICGRRRLAACKELGWRVIPTVVATDCETMVKAVMAERDENTCRKPFTPSEAVAIGKTIEDEWAKLNQDAKKEGQRKGGQTAGRGRPKDSSGKKNTKAKRDNSKRTKAKAAAAVGMSQPTYEKAAAVVASKDKQAIAEMDKTGNVSRAYQAVKKKQKAEELKRKAEAAKKMMREEPQWTLICQDVLDGLQSVWDHHAPARLIFADPPYNIGVDYGDGEDADRLPDQAYIDWVDKWLDMCMNVLSEDGSLWLMINDRWAPEFACSLRDMGLHFRAWIKWYETFGVNCANNFNRTSRHIFYCVRNPKDFVFNADAVTRPSDRQAKYNDKRANAGGKIWDDVWQIPRLTGTCKERIPAFPTQLPLELLRAIVGCSSDPGDLVVDPFNGSGTTGVACIEGDRRYIGIDKSEKFIDLATQRLTVAANEVCGIAS